MQLFVLRMGLLFAKSSVVSRLFLRDLLFARDPPGCPGNTSEKNLALSLKFAYPQERQHGMGQAV